ncbi:MULTISPECIES: tRNA-(ms[2]io[6]A)-hydroxylase [Cellulophaga]|jgi:tRNA-(ms[2]io[6]A)-hydroxylase|uniref:tRNA hydroxylase n=1 Tax=Cellulophaga baltica 18 TaxID=1348584 RepID=A0AAU8RTR3_9FLAO|nr:MULTISPECIES: tRNA-(ms[2]io[6]A)-hydroxylase [Cellulophaga]WFO14907.1 tRNA-(ms[2]io[6]A)-hydroxylase [Cellulophaga baltica 4]AIZ41099.1 tRNA hydroxylase [Cellulophaga baltica 18]MBA6313736.1 tRNA-(ms[2]io[6]A)-hydroxylase [Cellulophaga baltica]MCR1023288.1 tRNA-(ms[2]io[6]A)-hydroxylase [Cellulophaga baltica]QXP56470.1 tRNA-(ms[2]io[6]A)-hydroxylase [Cellulophaga sp. HaHa_2_95]
MLGLKLATDPRWAKLVETNIEEILTDHAWCEQKAATNAITIISLNSEHEELVTELLKLAQEELEHFQMVHDIIKQRGYTLGRERKDSYVNELFKIQMKGGSRQQALVNRLLFSAMIEARSCERFKVLSENIKDEELSKFYKELMISEAGHYTTFLGFARKYGGGIDVDALWKDLLVAEGEIIKNYGKSETIHG